MRFTHAVLVLALAAFAGQAAAQDTLKKIGRAHV